MNTSTALNLGPYLKKKLHSFFYETHSTPQHRVLRHYSLGKQLSESPQLQIQDDSSTNSILRR